MKGDFTMKPKILIINKNSMLTKDFMVHTVEYFNCISCSDLETDVFKHIDLFQPECCLYFMDTYTREQIALIRNLKSQKLPIIVIADREAGQAIQSNCATLVDLLIRRPVSPDNMTLLITNFLENRKQVLLEASLLKTLEETEENQKKNLLIVDDDRGILKMLKSCLEPHYNITSIINGTLVEKFIETKPCDLVILDYEMPIMTGYEVFKNLRENPETKDIPVIFLTGLTDSDKIKQIMQLRPNGYLLKPVNIELLMSAIKNVLMEDD